MFSEADDLPGVIADRYDKPRLIRIIKLAEIGIMALAALGFARAELLAGKILLPPPQAIARRLIDAWLYEA